MAITAKPRRAQLPLSGGQQGATVRVHPMSTAEIQSPPAFLQRPSGPLWLPRALLARRSRWTAVPIPCFLVEHPGVGPLLVDTGMAPGAAKSVRRALGVRAAMALKIAMRPEQAVTAQLAARGIDPGDVKVVVMTHLHHDHAGAIGEFARATFVVDRAEWDVARHGRFARGYNRRLIDHPVDWRELDFGAAGVDSYAAFGRALDLFDDGSVRLLSTPGHSPGHVSVLLRLEGGRELLLTGDAAYARRSIDDELLPLFVDDEHRYRRSLREIKRFVEASPHAEVICGHDAEGWPAVRDVYA